MVPKVRFFIPIMIFGKEIQIWIHIGHVIVEKPPKMSDFVNCCNFWWFFDFFLASILIQVTYQLSLNRE
jgi:hypothetical protein